MQSIHFVRAKAHRSRCFASLALVIGLLGLSACSQDQAVAPGSGASLNTGRFVANQNSNRDAAIEHAKQVQDRHTDELLAIDGVVGTGASVTASGESQVVVFTKNFNVRNIPAEIEGVKTHAEYVGE